MQFAPSADEARRHAMRCAVLLESAESVPERRLYRHLHDSWLRIAIQRELTDVVDTSKAVR